MDLSVNVVIIVANQEKENSYKDGIHKLKLKRKKSSKNKGGTYDNIITYQLDDWDSSNWNTLGERMDEWLTMFHFI